MFAMYDRRTQCQVDLEKGKIISLQMQGKELLNDSLPPLFELAFRTPKGEQLRTTAVTAANVEVSYEETSASAVYTGLSVEQVSVTVKVKNDAASGEMRWNIAVDNQSPYLLEWIDYPCITIKNFLRDNGGNGKILWPYNEGVLIDNMERRENSLAKYQEPEYPSMGIYGVFPYMVESQFLAALIDEGGMYLGAHDKNGGMKGINFYREGDGIRLQIRIYTASPAKKRYQMDYDVVCKLFDGDWYSAADIYRDWFEANKSDEYVPIEENKKLPAWYGESPLILTYPVRGRHDMDDMQPNKMFPYINAMPVVERFAKDTDSKIMALLMHWEGTAPWAPPFVWPPYGGEEAFTAFRDALHKAGHLLGVYCSGMGFTIQSNLVADYNCRQKIEEEHLDKIMCRAPSQELMTSRVCEGQRVGYDMCPQCDKTQDIIAEEVAKMCEGGVDYAQVFDQNHGGTAYFCYADDHGHPAGPGPWTVQAQKKLLQRILPKDNTVILGCESATSEPYIPYLLMSDNRFELNFHSGTPVPLYAYLYHKYVNHFMGNQCCLNFCHTEDNLLYRLAYSFTAGDLLTLVLTEDGEIAQHWSCLDFSILPDYQNTVDFVKRVNAFRTGIGKKYLHSGQMIKPFAVSCSQQERRFQMQNRDDLVVPALLTSSFEASDGTIGQIVVNYNKTEIPFALSVPKDKKCTLYRDGQGKICSSYQGETLTIDGLNALLFVMEK